MPAIDTVYTFATNPGAGPAVTAAAPGDSLNIRNFSSAGGQKAWLEHVFRRGATAGFARVRSPRFHDNVTGLNWNSGETEDTLVMPHEVQQPVYPADTLITEISGGAAESDALILLLYYEDIPGLNGQFLAPAT